MSDLILPLKREYFEQIRAGLKLEEYRLVNAYWAKRIVGRRYDRVVLTLGYPKADDHARRLIKPWRGYVVRTITHAHFGAEPVLVFAINVDSATDRANAPSSEEKS